MTDGQVGQVVRSVRRRRGLRQVDVAAMAGASATVVSRTERERLDEVSIRSLRRVAAVLEIDIGVTARWRGGELGRLLNDRHALLHGVVLELLERVGGWAGTPEVSFSVWGERGVVDIVAWHAVPRTILLVELKTELVDPQELVGVLDRRRRLGREIVPHSRSMDARWPGGFGAGPRRIRLAHGASPRPITVPRRPGGGSRARTSRPASG